MSGRLIPAPVVPPGKGFLETYGTVAQAREAVFWSRVDRSGGADACWPWTGANNSFYGHFRVAKVRFLVHRFALQVALGRPIADGKRALHHCDNPPCCNPAHLFEGTHTDNMADRSARGRTARGASHGSRSHPESVARGEAAAHSRLSAAQVVEIRRAFDAKESRVALAAKYGVSERTIRCIGRRRTWRHLPSDEPAVPAAPGDLGPGRVTSSRKLRCHCTRCSVRRTVDELVRRVAA